MVALKVARKVTRDGGDTWVEEDAQVSIVDLATFDVADLEARLKWSHAMEIAPETVRYVATVGELPVALFPRSHRMV